MSLVNGKAGETRSVLRRECLLHTPDAFVRTPMPGVRGGVVIVHASPELGAKFVQYTAELDAGGALEPVMLERFVWVLAGEAAIEIGFERTLLRAGWYGYLPPGFVGEVAACEETRLSVIERVYEDCRGFETPAAFVGDEREVPETALGGDENLKVKLLLPDEFGFDFAVNTMTYAPGAGLAQVEVHVMEHGLLMLEGGGTYRLGDDWYEVEAGDFIWMKAYCPQWFGAVGTGQAKYLIYKDWNRRPKL